MPPPRGGVLVAGLAVDGQAGSEGVCPEQVAFALVNSIAVVAAVLAVEHAALGETRHGHSEDDGEGDYLFFHRCIFV